jgi:hypothetical protein
MTFALNIENLTTLLLFELKIESYNIYLQRKTPLSLYPM